jgi:hypothetical protein
MDGLAPTYRLLAPDLYGAGKTPDWHSDRVITLADQAAPIEPVLQRAAPRRPRSDRRPLRAGRAASHAARSARKSAPGEMSYTHFPP